jgi:hypothetical protein
MLLRILPVVLLLGVAAGCSSTPPVTTGSLPDDAVVTYAFHDASVPPAYHRSVTLTVTKGESRIVVDSYGEVLADQKAPTTAAVWAALGGTLASVNGITVVEPSAGCVGGTGIDVTVSSGRQDLAGVSAQFCGGSNPKAKKALDAWIAPARALFPTTDVLAP